MGLIRLRVFLCLPWLGRVVGPVDAVSNVWSWVYLSNAVPAGFAVPVGVLNPCVNAVLRPGQTDFINLCRCDKELPCRSLSSLVGMVA